MKIKMEFSSFLEKLTDIAHTTKKPSKIYCKLYAERYLPGKAANLAKGAKVIWLQEPTGKYKALGGGREE